jgi:hypothetical protein
MYTVLLADELVFDWDEREQRARAASAAVSGVDDAERRNPPDYRLRCE